MTTTQADAPTTPVTAQSVLASINLDERDEFTPVVRTPSDVVYAFFAAFTTLLLCGVTMTVVGLVAHTRLTSLAGLALLLVVLFFGGERAFSYLDEE